MTVEIPNSQVQGGFNIHELTDGTLGGTGVFDVLMDSVKAHLWYEYDKQRIRGTDYANAYIRLAEVAMQVSADYAMRKAKLGAELTLLQKELDIKTKQVELAEYDLRHIKPEELRLKQAELAQVNAQKDLYAQKVITERAQTDPAVIKPDSHIDKNNQVLTAQAKSFSDDSKIKMSSIMADVWKVAHSTDANGMKPTTDSFTGAANIKQVLERTAQSVGA